MSKLVEKVLRSGLVDKHTVALLEKFGSLEPGSTEKVNEGALKNATKQQLTALAEDLALEVEREAVIRETYLDLEKLRYPATGISLYDAGKGIATVSGLSAMQDRMGRYFFRYQDVDYNWFCIGMELEKTKAQSGEMHYPAREAIIAQEILYIDETPVCIQITTEKVK
jgi:hypothetical protein